MKSLHKKLFILLTIFSLAIQLIYPLNTFALDIERPSSSSSSNDCDPDDEDYYSCLVKSLSNIGTFKYSEHPIYNERYSFSHTDTNDFYFKSFDADYYLSLDEDGSSVLKVEEDLTAVFPSFARNHGIERVIPTYNIGGNNEIASGKGALNFSVTRNGKSEPYSTPDDDDSSYITFRIGDADDYVTGEQNYHIEYTYRNVITEFDKDDNNVTGIDSKDIKKVLQELYWNTNGTGWEQPFLSLTANVHLSDEFLDNLHPDREPSCYIGKLGEKNVERCDITETTDGYKFETDFLNRNENLTFSIEFNPGVAKVKMSKSYSLVIFTLLSIVIFGGIAIAIFKKYNSSTKEKEQFFKNSFVAPQYQPDLELTVAEAAELTMKAKQPSYVATLIEIAVSGHITMSQKEENGVFKKKTVWTIKINKLEGLNTAQKNVIKLLKGSTSELSNGEEFEVKSRSYSSALSKLAESYNTATYDTLNSKNLYTKKSSTTYKVNLKAQPEDPTKKKLPGIFYVFIVLGIIALAVIYMMSFVGMIDGLINMSNLGKEGQILADYKYIGKDYLLLFVIPYIIIMIIVISIFGSKNLRFEHYTAEGLKKAVYFEGLKLYIKMAEQDRIKFHQSVGAATDAQGICKLYEKLLPYAIIFDLEKSWSDTLGKYYALDEVSNPTWCPGFTTGVAFSSSIHSMNSSFSSSISSGSSSSGSGGSGGSGGGGGGGGGGGW